MNEQEQEAHDEVLRLCGKTPAGGWVMRSGAGCGMVGNKVVQQRPCNVFNLSHSSPYAVDPRRLVVADGATWVEVWEQLEADAQLETEAYGLQGRGPDARDCY